MGSLALAGAVAGAGKGLAEEAQFTQETQAKADAAKAANDMETQRQTALERMRNDNANQIEDKRAGTQMAVAGKQQEWHEADVKAEIGSKEKEGSNQRAFLGKQGEANRQNRKDIATIRASASMAGKGGKAPKTWTFHNVAMQGSFSKDPASGQTIMIPGKQFSVLQHRDGRQFVQVGDKFLPYDASKDEIPKADSVRRASSSEVDKLVQNPDQADNFLSTYHYLPMPWFQAAQQKTDTKNAQLTGWGKNAVPSNATVSGPAYLMGGSGGEADESDADDNAADEQDASSTAGVSGNGYAQ